MKIKSKLPNVGTTIFTVMSRLAAEHQAINLSQGFPNFDGSKKLLERVEYYLQNGYNQYAPMVGVSVLNERLAQKIENLYGLTIDPQQEITITAGATQAIYTIISAFVNVGDEVIIIEPAYDSYRPSIEVNGGVAVCYELEAPDYRVDWTAFAELISDKTRMIIFNTPHNPTGKVWSEADLKMLEKLTTGTDIIVLSDEVYEHLVYDGAEHQSVFRYPDLYQRSFATFSFGKTFHNTGWRIGYCVGPPQLMKEFRKVHQFNVFSVNTPTQYGIADFLNDPQEYLSLNQFYQEKRDFFLKAIEGSRFRPIHCEGTYFQLLDYSAISDEKDTDFAKRMTTEFGVAVIPVSVFYSSKRNDKVIRVCFAKTEDVLSRAADVIRNI